MTDSVKFEQPAHDPIASSLSAADDRIVLSEWLPPQKGIVARIRMGRRWCQHLVVDTDRGRGARPSDRHA
jgi:hypothetical protein